MASQLEEDFSDVAGFVQEDEEEQTASEDEVERKIAEEHAKYKEAQAKRQEEVRASRPWSAPPVESPRPEQQKERERERQARGSNPDAAVVAPRAEYEPPARSYLLQAQASGSNLSYLSRPQSAELRPGSRLLSRGGSRASLSGIEEETGEGTGTSSRQASDFGRLGSHNLAEARSSTGVTPDDAPARDHYDAIKEEEGEGEGADGAAGGRLGGTNMAAAREGPAEAGVAGDMGEPPESGLLTRAESGMGGDGQEEEEEEEGGAGALVGHRAEVSAEEVVEDEAGGGSSRRESSGVDAEASGGGPYGGVGRGSSTGNDGGLGVSSEAGLDATFGWPHQPQRQRGSSGGGAGKRDAEGLGSGGSGDGILAAAEGQEGSSHGLPYGSRYETGRFVPPSGPTSASVSATATPRSMALRGFVEPLGYENSYGGRSAGKREGASAAADNNKGEDDEGVEEDRDRSEGDEKGGSEGEEEEEEEDYEDSFESDEETEGTRTTATAAPAPPSAEPSSVRAPSVASKTTSVRSKDTSSLREPPSKEPSRAKSPVPPPSQSSTPGIGTETSSSLPPPPPAAESSAASAAAAAVLQQSTISDTPPPPSPPPPPPLVIAAPPPVPVMPPARSPLSALSQRSMTSGCGTSAAAPPADTDLLPPQQFALQLLKHDIDVLPQHHRAAAEAAAAARRKAAAAARPAGAGLAAFGYLGYHMMPDDLTAASGPGFRTGSGSGSPGRGASPGRSPGVAGGGGAGVAVTVTAKAARHTTAEQAAGAVVQAQGGAGGKAGGPGRPVSAPHMRPNSGTADGVAVKDVAARGAGTDMGDMAVQPVSSFIGTARDMRGGRLLPTVAPAAAAGPVAAPQGRRMSSGGSGRPAATPDPTDPGSLSILDEQELQNVQQSRIKFDVWLDSLAGTNAPPSGPGKAAGNVHGATTGPRTGGGDFVAPPVDEPGGRRPPRPMTAPASGRRRPVSARPVAGMYGMQPPTMSVPKPLARPVSAQPYMHPRPTSASVAAGSARGATGTGREPGVLLSDTISVPLPSSAAAGAADTIGPAPPPGGTAAVEVGGVTVSVYVADTQKRIVEANRWLQQLGVATKRYRLKDRMSAMTVQLLEELPPLPSERGVYDAHDGGAIAVVVKELTLKQFLSGHAKLKQQAKKLRAQAAAAAAAAGSVVAGGPTGSLGMMMIGQGAIGGGGGAFGLSDYGGQPATRGHRPFSASPALGGGGGGGNVGGSNRVRPASAVPHSSGMRATASSAGGADPPSYGAGAAGGGGGAGGMTAGVYGGGYPAARPARPSSANPAYGRTPMFGAFNSNGSSPPGGFAGAAGGRHSSTAISGGGGTVARTAWAAGPNGTSTGGYAQHLNYTVTSTAAAVGGGLPYMHRSVSATARTPTMTAGILDDDYDDGEPALTVEPDENGDVSKAVRQQLGGAADYCQVRRQEIARLRTMPFA